MALPQRHVRCCLGALLALMLGLGSASAQTAPGGPHNASDAAALPLSLTPAPYWGMLDTFIVPEEGPSAWPGESFTVWLFVGSRSDNGSDGAWNATLRLGCAGDAAGSPAGLAAGAPQISLNMTVQRAVQLELRGWNASDASVRFSHAWLHTQHCYGAEGPTRRQRWNMEHEVVPCAHPSRRFNEGCSGQPGGQALWLRVAGDAFRVGGDAALVAGLATNSSTWEGNDTAVAPMRLPAVQVPVVAGAASMLRQIDMASEHACAVRRDGTLTCWGSSNFFTLGMGGTSEAPISRGGDPATLTLYAGGTVDIGRVFMVSTGKHNTCVVKRDHTIACWGFVGSAISSSSTLVSIGSDQRPVTPDLRMTGVEGPWVAVSVGTTHAVGLRSDGTVFAWGQCLHGACGTGPGTVIVIPGQGIGSIPPSVPLPGPVVQVSAGRHLTCAVLFNASAICFGDNNVGTLGVNEGKHEYGPRLLVQTAPLAQVEVGTKDVACGVRLDGQISCWGGASQLLGLGGRQNVGSGGGPSWSLTPSDVVNAGSDFVRVLISNSHACGIRVGGAVFCWGANLDGELGSLVTGRGSQVGEPGSDRSSWWGGPAVDIATGVSATCVIRQRGDLSCLGSGAGGVLSRGIGGDAGGARTGTDEQLQLSTTLHASQYVLHNPLRSRVNKLVCSASTSACCVVFVGNRLNCFGRSASGLLGWEHSQNVGEYLGTLHADMEHPVRDVHDVTVNKLHSCVIFGPDRRVRCWGRNLVGPILNMDQDTTWGDSRETVLSTELLMPIGSGIVSVSAGLLSTCAVRGDAAGSVVCWGFGLSGQLGYGTLGFVGGSYTPLHPGLSVPNLGSVSMVSSGASHVCAIRRDTSVVCWGTAGDGRLGLAQSGGAIGDAPGEITPSLAVNVGGVAHVAAGSDHTCAIRLNGTLVCWGRDPLSRGYLGCGGCADRGSPSTPFLDPSSYTVDVGQVVHVDVSDATTCVARTDGSMLCWGDNTSNQLGFGGQLSQFGELAGDLNAEKSLPIGANIGAVAAGLGFSCAQRTDGRVACWGSASGLRTYQQPAAISLLDISPDLSIRWDRHRLRIVDSRFVHPSLVSLPADIDARFSPHLRAVPALATSRVHLLKDLTSMGSGPLNRADSCPGQVLVKWGANSVCSYDPSLPVWWQRTPTASIDKVTDVSTGVWGEHIVVPGLGARIRLGGQLHWVAMWGVPQVFIGNGSVPCTHVEVPEWDQLECTVGTGVGANLSVTILSGPEAFVPVVRRGRLVSYAPPRLDTVVVDSRDNPISALVADPAGGQALRLIGRNFGVDVSQAAVFVGGVECPLISAGVFSFTDGEAFCRLPSRPALQGSEGWAAGMPFQAAVRVTVGGQEAAQDVGIEIGAPLFLQVLPPAVQVGHASSNNTVNVTLQGRYLGHNASAVSSLFIAGQVCPGHVWDRPTPHVWSLTCIDLPAAGLNTSAPPIAVTAFGEAFTQLDALEIVPPPDMTPLRIISSGPGSTQHEQAITLRGIGIGAVALDVLRVEVSDWGACHSVSWVDSSEVSCMAPAGAGNAEPVRVFLAGGHVLRGQFQYAAPPVHSIWPNTLLPWKANHPGGNVTMQLCTDGTRWSPPGRLLTASDVAIQVAGAPCVFQAQLNATCLSCRVDTAAVVSGAASSVHVRGAQASFAPGVGVQVLSLPQVSAVVPPLVSAAGGQVVEVLGIGFCRNSSSDVKVVRVGSQPAAVRSCTSTSMSVTVPRPPDSAQTARINITLVSGHSAILQDALQFSRPEVLTVLGGLVQPAPQGSQQIRNVSVTGLALDDGPRSRAGLLFGSAPGLSCAQAGGELVFTSARSLECRGFHTAALAPLVSGRMADATITIRTAQNLTAKSSLGTLRIMGPPQISELSSSSAAVNDTLTVTGSGFGLAQTDIAAVWIGARQVTTFTRGSDSIVTLRVPEPASDELADVFSLDVAISLTSGHTAVLPRSFSYTLAPRAPVSAPSAVCPYRDEAGAARVAFNWTDDAATLLSPIGAWHVSFGVILHGGLISRVNASTRLVSLTGGAAGDILRNVDTPRACRGLTRHPSTLDVSVRIADAPSQPFWVAVAAGVLGESAGRVLRGPLSTEVGPLLPACGAAEYLATHELGEGRWPQVTCRPCPQGAVCNGAEWERVLAAPGWFRIPWREPDISFEACVSEDVCPGESQSPIQVPSRHYTFSAFQALPGLGAASLNTTAAGNSSNTFASNPQSPCEASRTGPLCAACAEGYTGQGDGSQPCTRCAPTWLNWLGVVGGIAVAGVLVAALTRSALASGGAPTKAHVALNKVLLTHLQQVGIAAAFPLAWPSELRGMFSVFDAASNVGDALISVNCLGLDSTSAFRGTQILTLLLPAALGLGILIVWRFLVPLIWQADGSRALSCTLCRRNGEAPPAEDAHAAATASTPGPQGARQSAPQAGRETRVSNPMRARSRASSVQRALRGPAASIRAQARTPTRQGTVVSFLVMCFVLHLGLTRSALSLFTCRMIGGRAFLVGDVQISCDDRQHQAWMYGVGLSAFVLYGCGITAASLTLLWVHRATLETPATRQVYGFLYAAYAQDRYFWEAAVQGRKVALACISVLLAPAGIGAQAHFGILLMVGALAAHASLSPYRLALVNHSETASLLVTISTLAAGVSLLDQGTSAAMHAVATWSVILMNVVFIVVAAGLVAHSLLSSAEIKAHLSSLRKGMSKVRLLTASAPSKSVQDFAEAEQPMTRVGQSGPSVFAVRQVGSGNRSALRPAHIARQEKGPKQSTTV